MFFVFITVQFIIYIRGGAKKPRRNNHYIYLVEHVYSNNNIFPPISVQPLSVPSVLSLFYCSYRCFRHNCCLSSQTKIVYITIYTRSPLYTLKPCTNCNDTRVSCRLPSYFFHTLFKLIFFFCIYYLCECRFKFAIRRVGGILRF